MISLKSIHSSLVIALDVENDEQSKAAHKLLNLHTGPIKYGPSTIPDECGTDRVIVDYKIHDIPRTAARAISNIVYSYEPMAITIHTMGGREMLRACVDASHVAAAMIGIKPPSILGVTVLTSISEEDWEYIGIRDRTEMKSRIMSLAYLARTCGLDGIVCSPLEVKMVRQAFREDFIVMVPGVRDVLDKPNDHQRVGSVRQTIADGADMVVVGRPLLNSTNPVGKYNIILSEIESGLMERKGVVAA